MNRLGRWNRGVAGHQREAPCFLEAPTLGDIGADL